MIEPIYRNTTLNTVVFNFYTHWLYIYSGPANKGNVVYDCRL